MRTAVERWRLVLGRFAGQKLGDVLSPSDLDRDAALAFLYDREYAERGLSLGGDRGAGSEATRLRALDWLKRAEELFPNAALEVLRDDAIARYALNDLLRDPRLLADLAPSPTLLRAVLSFRDRGDPTLRAEIRAIAQKIVNQLMRRLRVRFDRTFSGRHARHSRSRLRIAANFDARRTIRANLAGYDPERKRLMIAELHFMARQKRHLDWTIILCVDQSGSMTDSVIFAALMAAILTGMPGVRVKMVLFDVAIVDVTDHLDDPLSLLLSMQLGGGTDIGKAVSYCEGLVETPTRTVLALISDFMEGGSPRRLLAAVARLREARVRMLGLAALDDTGRADYDRDMAGRLASVGMNVAALTPEAFADWLAKVLQ
ncbi:MAG: VWA domain-containing protein [Hyphomicrobiaceae bacterium]|nr:VWA domain-containing protein [Hyphomicrobiaceae bacterium]